MKSSMFRDQTSNLYKQSTALPNSILMKAKWFLENNYYGVFPIIIPVNFSGKESWKICCFFLCCKYVHMFLNPTLYNFVFMRN